MSGRVVKVPVLNASAYASSIKDNPTLLKVDMTEAWIPDYEEVLSWDEMERRRYGSIVAHRYLAKTRPSEYRVMLLVGGELSYEFQKYPDYWERQVY